MNPVTLAFDLALAAVIVWETARFAPRYRRFKAGVAAGDPLARTRLYRRILRFEWLTGALALAAIRFDLRALDPRGLGLGQSSLLGSFAGDGAASAGLVTGMLAGVALGTVGFVIVRLRARRSAAGAPPAARAPWRRLLPDFGAMLPVTGRERLLWLAASVSAGVCEELVFRGWLLAMLHGPLGLGGTALVIGAAAVFGLAHAYQGVPGVILTALAGAVFCALYVATGSLLVPMALHALVDARFALVPTGRAEAVPAPRAA